MMAETGALVPEISEIMAMDLDGLLKLDPYSLVQSDKERLLCRQAYNTRTSRSVLPVVTDARVFAHLSVVSL